MTNVNDNSQSSYAVKHCNFCNSDKPLNEFSSNFRLLYGVSNKCKGCTSENRKEGYLKNKEKAIARARAWAKSNIERRREIVRKSDAKNREKKRNSGRNYARAKREADIHTSRIVCAYNAARRKARIIGVKSTLTIDQIKWLFEKANGICVYCGTQTAHLTLDHFIPFSNGGENTLKNAMPCCDKCNFSKHNYEPGNWLDKKHGIDGLKRAIVFVESLPAYRLKNKMMLKERGINIHEV